MTAKKTTVSASRVYGQLISIDEYRARRELEDRELAAREADRETLLPEIIRYVDRIFGQEAIHHLPTRPLPGPCADCVEAGDDREHDIRRILGRFALCQTCARRRVRVLTHGQRRGAA